MTTPQTTDPRPRTPGFVSVIRAEEYWVTQSRRNIGMFMTYMSDGERSPASHHIDWFRYILDPKIKRLLIVAPRESAKTTVAINALSWLIGHFPHLTNIISSVSSKQAEERLDAVRQYIQLPRFRNVFPHIHIDENRPNHKSELSVWSEKWPGSDKTNLSYQAYRSLVASYGDVKNPTIHAPGITSAKIIGSRFSGIALIDDPHDAKNSATEEQREKVMNFFITNILGGVQHSGKIIVITTRWAETDMAGRLMDMKNASGVPIWTVVNTPAIDESTGISYWPEYWTLDKLEDKRAEVGEIMFQTMYMNNPLGATTGMFESKHLVYDIPEDAVFDKIVVSNDMAKTKTANSDYTVSLAIAKDKNKPFKYYILDGIRGKYNFNEGITEIAKFSDRIFETYGRLDGVVFEEPFDSIHAEEMRNMFPSLPVVTVKPKGDKGQRLGGVAVKAQAGNLYINQDMKILPALKSEFLGFPKASHDDICDAASLPLQLDMWATNYSAGLKKIDSPFLL